MQTQRMYIMYIKAIYGITPAEENDTNAINQKSSCIMSKVQNLITFAERGAGMNAEVNIM